MLSATIKIISIYHFFVNGFPISGYRNRSYRIPQIVLYIYTVITCRMPIFYATGFGDKPFPFCRSKVSNIGT